jgi:hypothetical protein
MGCLQAEIITQGTIIVVRLPEGGEIVMEPRASLFGGQLPGPARMATFGRRVRRMAIYSC